ncbi:glycoside hydrolase family 38 C-terminal domain-containing protein [Paenibacillus sp. NPDC058071]|uniref:alpha-mannosidase n=1 Tax=Paenibacillus sp. NPDC058071 TaxID=3346326 RepID=UPI0036D95996
MYTKERLFHIKKWIKGKENLLYRELSAATFDYAPLSRWASYEEAQQLPFSPALPGEVWGEKWQYGWFHSTIELPPEAAGKRIELLPRFGSESTVYVNGILAGAIDLQHKTITLTTSGEPGARYEIMAEAYAGHDRELPLYTHGSLVVSNEELYQFFIDLESLTQLHNSIASESLRAAEIEAGFEKLIALMDWSLEGDVLEEAARQGRAVMKPLLDCVNGSTAPKLFMMGQSHLDIAWLWPIEETKRKIARTLSNQLALLEQYPEYIYVQSQPYLLQLTKELYPELYERVKQYVAEGRIVLEGAMWLEPDTNIPSGESLVRQLLYGKAFLQKEFGKDSEMLWLPDVFGYSGALPQLMRKSGVNYFASVKMYQTYDNEVDPFPYNTFMWEGIDGSAVPVHLLDYGPFPNPADVNYANFQWNERIQKYGISTRLVQFGYGDGGGGANRSDLEFLRRMKNLEGAPKTEITSPIAYFEDLEQRGGTDNRYVGELYYSAHRGTFTSQAAMKKGNRAGEAALREAETLSTMAALFAGKPYPAAELEETWKKLLLLQFHDILPGTSIHRVHVEARQGFEDMLQSAARLSQEAASALVGVQSAAAASGWTLFNVLPWKRRALLELPEGYAGGATDSLGRSLPVQEANGKRFALATLPAGGSLSIEPSEAAEAVGGDAAGAIVRATNDSLENEWLHIRFNGRGEIVSVWDKERETEWTNGLCNQFRLFRDQTSDYDAWELDRRYAASELELTEAAEIRIATEGPLFAELEISRRIGQSDVVQTIRLEAGSRRVDFKTRIDWQERHKLLKVGFDVNLHTNEALHEMQYGFVKRPNHFSRPHDADRYEVSQHRWSAFVEGDRCFSLLNDSKYGINTYGKEMNLTLLRAPSYPDETADLGVHEFTFAMHIWNGGFSSNPVIREAAELNTPIARAAGIAGAYEGLLIVSAPNVIVDSVKMAEDGSGDVIARLYEAKGMSAARVSLNSSFRFASLRETDLLEGNAGEELVSDNSSDVESEVHLSFKPFEVKTLRFARI